MSSTRNIPLVSEACFTDAEIQQQRPKCPHRLRRFIVAAALFLLLLTALFAIVYLHNDSISVLGLEELVLRKDGEGDAASLGGALGGAIGFIVIIVLVEYNKERDDAKTAPGPQAVQNTDSINNEPMEPRP